MLSTDYVLATYKKIELLAPSVFFLPFTSIFLQDTAFVSFAIEGGVTLSQSINKSVSFLKGSPHCGFFFESHW